MILHILVGDLALDKLPKKVKWIKLQVFADDINEYGIHSDQFFGENIVRFNQTIHCPVNELESVITKASFVVQAILFNGTYLPIGSSSLLCSSMEQPTTKSVVIHDKLEAYVGRLTVTVFHNLTPIELNEGEILTKQNNYSPNLKEYAFLLSRRANRKPGSEYDHPITFNHRLEASVNESVNDTFKIQQFLAGNNGTKVKTKTALNTGARKAKTTAPNTLTKRVVQKSTDPRAHVYTSQIYQNQNKFIRPPINQLNAIYNTPHSVHGATAASNTKTRISSPYEKPLKRPVSTSTRRPLSGRTEPQLRSTQMRVGYAHTQWPDAKAAEVQHEKKMYSLFLAEERRLALLREVNEEVKFKNKQTKLRIAENKARRAKTARDDSQLKDVLCHKEREISVLRAQLQYMKTHKQHLESRAEHGGNSELPIATHNCRGRVKSSANSVGNNKPLTRRSSSAPVRRSSNTAIENADKQFSGFIPPRSPHSQLNYENTMALRALQRSENKHQNSYHPVHITVPGGNYTPIHRASSPYEVKVHSVSTTESKKSHTSSAAGSLHSGSERRRRKAHSDAPATGTSSNHSKVLRAANELHRKSTDNTYHRYNAKQQKLSRHEAKLASANYPPNSASRSHNNNSRLRSMSGSFGVGISTNTTNNKSRYGSGNLSDNGTNHYNRHNNSNNNNNNNSNNNNNGNVESIATDWLASARASVNQLHSSNNKNNDNKSSYRSNKYRNSNNSEHTYDIINEMNNSYPHRHFEHGKQQQQRTNSSKNNGKRNSSKRNKTNHNVASSDDNSVFSRDLSLDGSEIESISNSSSGNSLKKAASFSDSSDESEIEVIYQETLRNYNNKQNINKNTQKESKKNNFAQQSNKPLATANDRQIHGSNNGNNNINGNSDSYDRSEPETNDDYKVPGFLNSFVNQLNIHPQHSNSIGGGHLDDSFVSTATADLIPVMHNRSRDTENNNNHNNNSNNYSTNNNVSRLSTESILKSAEKQQQLQQQAGEGNMSAAHTAQNISDKARYQLVQLRHTSMVVTNNNTINNNNNNNNSSGNDSMSMNNNSDKNNSTNNNSINNNNNNNKNHNNNNNTTTSSSSSSVDKQYKYNFTIPTAAKLTNSNALDSDIYDAQHAVDKIHSTVETQFEKNKQFSDLSVEKQSRKNTGGNSNIQNNGSKNNHNSDNKSNNNGANDKNRNNNINNNSNNSSNSNTNNMYRKSPTEFTDTLKYNYNIVPTTHHNNNEQHNANITNGSVLQASSVDSSDHPLPMMLLPHDEKEKIIQHQFEKNRLYVANSNSGGGGNGNNTAIRNNNSNNSTTASATKTAAEIRAQHQAAQSPDRNIIPNNASNNTNNTNRANNTVSPSRRAVSHLPLPEAMNRTLNDVSDAISTLEARLNKFSSLGPSHTADMAANDHSLLKSTTVVTATKSRSVLHHNESSSSSDSSDSDNSVVKFGQSLKGAKVGSNNNTTGSSNEYKSYFKEVVTTTNHDTVAKEIAKSVRNYKDSVSRGEGTRSPMEQDSLEMSYYRK